MIEGYKRPVQWSIWIIVVNQGKNDPVQGTQIWDKVLDNTPAG